MPIDLTALSFQVPASLILGAVALMLFRRLRSGFADLV
jgi:hypothetical protein